MRIILVRHRHPDYATDTLTGLGHRHAAAAAQRLKDEEISDCPAHSESTESIRRYATLYT